MEDPIPPVATLKGHTDVVLCCCALPDGRIVSGGEDKTCIVWGLDGSIEHICEGHADGVFCLAVCPDGQFVSGSFDWTLILWDPDTGNKVRCMGGKPHTEGHTRDITTLTVSRPGTESFVCENCSLENPIAAALQPPLKVCGGCGHPSSAKYNLKDYWIVSASLDETICLWYADDRIKPRKFVGHEAPVGFFSCVPLCVPRPPNPEYMCPPCGGLLRCYRRGRQPRLGL